MNHKPQAAPTLTERPFTFTFQGIVKAKERPRTVTKGGRTWTYTPKDTKDSEQDLKACILERLGRERPDKSGRFAVEIVCIGQRGDGDNILKTVLDAGNGLLWEDDKQVDSLRMTKMMGQSSWIEVTVRKVEAGT